jgi:hypothetical protein
MSLKYTQLEAGVPLNLLAKTWCAPPIPDSNVVDISPTIPLSTPYFSEYHRHTTHPFQPAALIDASNGH